MLDACSGVRPFCRCQLHRKLIALSFYEWKLIKGQRDRQPIYIAPKVADIPFPTDDLNKTVKTEEDIDLLAGHLPFFEIAGIYDFWKDPDTGELVYTFATITSEPSKRTQVSRRQSFLSFSPIHPLLFRIFCCPRSYANHDFPRGPRAMAG